ncbi:hypothetical protein AV530_005844 [Patagioenas fasciata monilis]|uniref:Uncharacterized protein n=1 Tax=Patagioenas fasciata monilis TaxID=372326 RepID=A0A1V4JMU1_PATFA|nr:hypothetical protein AV530_005844 [Patagioenas fasciata monilis]
MVQTMVRQAVPLQHMEIHGGAEIHLQPVEDPTPEQEDALEEVCDPMGSPCWSRLLAGPVAPWREQLTLEQVCWQDLGTPGRPMLEQYVPEELQPMEVTHAGAVHGGLQPMARTLIEVYGGLSLVGGTPCWSRERV